MRNLIIFLLFLVSCKKDPKTSNPSYVPPACTKTFSGNYAKIDQRIYAAPNKYIHFDTGFFVANPNGTMSVEFTGYNREAGPHFYFKSKQTCDSFWVFNTNGSTAGSHYEHNVYFEGDILVDSVTSGFWVGEVKDYNIYRYRKY